MGDRRFQPDLERVKQAADPGEMMASMGDTSVIAALAAASRDSDPYLANVLATEALNRVRRTNAIIRNLGEGVIVIDPVGEVVLANPKAERLLGWRLVDLLGRRLHDVVGHSRQVDGSNEPIPVDLHECPILNVFEEGRPARGEGDDIFTRRDGSSFLVEYSATPIRRQEAIDGAVVVFRDVTRRRVEEQRLRVFEAAVDQLPEPVFVIDRDGRVIFANAEAARTFAFDRDEFTGRTVFHVDPGLTEDRWQRTWEELDRDGHMVVPGNFVTTDGPVPVVVRGRRIAHNGRGYMWVVVQPAERASGSA